MDNNANEETIKCVVVGDNNVGKTKLVCARAYRSYASKVDHLRYLKIHVPTVWALDHYRTDPLVLKYSRETLDGWRVSLRLWDTFGDHNKNRVFAYGQANCVVVCFSVGDPKSFQNVKSFWIPEVRKHCKKAPIILVGCKIDLRYADLDDINRKKASVSKKLEACDILYPEVCRNFAEDMGLPYYEVSVLEGFGVRDVFENVLRVCVPARGLFSSFSRPTLNRPLFQKPLEPPKPSPPPFPAVEDAPVNFGNLYQNPVASDLRIVGENFEFPAHKVVLAAASHVFYRIFEIRSNTTILDSNHNPDGDNFKGKPTFQDSDYPEFVARYQFHNAESDVLTLTADITEFAFLSVMHFIYTGSLQGDISHGTQLEENHQRSELLTIGTAFGVTHFVEALEWIYLEHPDKMLPTVQFDVLRKYRLNTMFLCKDLYSDIVFVADNGSLPAHKALLVCGSDMMSAMLLSDFVEKGNKALNFPETTVECLQIAFEYIYTKAVNTDSIAIEFGNACDDIIALANRLCLPELVLIVEAYIVKKFNEKAAVGTDRELYENVLCMLEVAHIHNAPNLAKWCVYFLATNYNDVCKKCKKVMKCLSDGNLKRVQSLRWPPVWYIKDLDAYERACRGCNLSAIYMRRDDPPKRRPSPHFNY